MSVMAHPEYEIDYAIFNFHFTDNCQKRFIPDACSGNGKGVIICYDLIGDRKDISFLLENPFKEDEKLKVWEGKERVINPDDKTQIRNLIANRKDELIFYGMAEI